MSSKPLADDFWDRVYDHKNNIVTRKIADETILVPIYGNLADMQRIFSLTPVAAFIWERLDGVRPLKDIRMDITQTFDVDEATAGADISELIHSLAGFRLITDIRE